MVTMHRRKDEIMVEDVAKTIGREMRTRYLNPQWIEGMKKENYGGARQMADFAENLWGWQVTVRDAVDEDKWRQVFEVYVEDKYGMELSEFFDEHNPWAYQSMTARMLEAVRKGYWETDEKTTRKLAAEYAVNVVEKGVACCDHTCNNPMLNQMTVNLISIPGVLSPEMVEKFKLAVEKAAKSTLEQQTADRKVLLEKLAASQTAPSTNPPTETAADQKAEPREPSPNDPAEDTAEKVEGYKMEDMDTKDETSELTSSGIQWTASLFILAIIGLFVWGGRKKKEGNMVWKSLILGVVFSIGVFAVKCGVGLQYYILKTPSKKKRAGVGGSVRARLSALVPGEPPGAGGTGFDKAFGGNHGIHGVRHGRAPAHGPCAGFVGNQAAAGGEKRTTGQSRMASAGGALPGLRGGRLHVPGLSHRFVSGIFLDGFPFVVRHIHSGQRPDTPDGFLRRASERNPAGNRPGRGHVADLRLCLARRDAHATVRGRGVKYTGCPCHPRMPRSRKLAAPGSPVRLFAVAATFASGFGFTFTKQRRKP